MRIRRRASEFSEEASGYRPASGDTFREIQSSEAKTHLPQLLDQVERGATFIITRHGRPIARLVPDPEHHGKSVSRAADQLQEIRKGAGKITLEELLALRHQGHKY